jgi:AAA15 family ATPase/GTPase
MIHGIRIQNFKSLRDVTVGLSPVTVFIGKSGTGKTNFASAIRFLRDYLASGQVPDYAQDQVAWKCATNRSGATQFDVEFDIPGFADRFVYTLSLDEQNWNNPPRIESLKCGVDTVFRQTGTEAHRGRGPAWEVEPALVSPPEPGPLALGRLPGLEEAVLAHTGLTAGIGVYSFPYSVLRRPAGVERAFGLADRGENFLQVLREVATGLQSIATRKSISAALRRINPTVASVELDSIQNPTRVIVGHRLKGKILALELNEESDGFRRFYAHLLALYQTPPKQTLVFEEPENGIYPGALELLADEFKAAPDAGRGQVLLTTHSPVLLDSFSAEHIRVVELEDLETRIGPLAEEQREALREQLLHAGELLTVDPARIAQPAAEATG